MEMTPKTTVKAALILVALCVVTYFIYANWDFWSGRVIDHSVSMSGPYERPGKVGEENHKYLEYVFATGQEKLHVTEIYVSGDLAQRTYIWYSNPRQMNEGTQRNDNPIQTRLINPLDKTLADLSDPVRRAKLKNVFGSQNRANIAPSYVILAGLDKDKKPEEADLRAALNTKLSIIDDGAKDGTSSLKAFKKITDAIQAAKANPNDADKDPKKTALIRTVLGAVHDYDDKINELRINAVQQYVDGVQKLFTDAQAAKADEFLKRTSALEEQAANAPPAPPVVNNRNRGNNNRQPPRPATTPAPAN